MTIHCILRLPPRAGAHLTALAVGVAITLATLATLPTLADNGGLPMAEPESVGMSSERLLRIGEGMRRLIDDDKIPGTVTLVARRGKVVHFEANGLRDVEAGLPMEHDTIFRLYSQSKVVTGAAVMLLFEEGHFLMTDPVSKYLPEFSDMQVYIGEEDGEIVTEPAAAPITIQQLATHTSGMTYSFFPSPVGRMYAANGVVATGTPLPIPSEECRGGSRRRGRNAQGMEQTRGRDAARRAAGDRVALQRRHGCTRALGGSRIRHELRRLPAGTPLRTARDA